MGEHRRKFPLGSFVRIVQTLFVGGGRVVKTCRGPGKWFDTGTVPFVFRADQGFSSITKQTDYPFGYSIQLHALRFPGTFNTEFWQPRQVQSWIFAVLRVPSKLSESVDPICTLVTHGGEG